MKSDKLVLIAEDDYINYKVIYSFLKKFNITVHWTKNWSDTFVYCLKKNVHLVLMDIKMPIMDGLQATYLIKKHKPDIIIIAQTALTMYGDKEMCIEAGCDDYISKPIDFKILSEKMENFLSMESAFYK